MSALALVQEKILDWEQAKWQCELWKKSGAKIIFTNGCFDLIHYGHLQYLAEASRLGDKLVIGLNSDQSVARLKGRHRPIKDEKNRGALLASLLFVDLVVKFEEDTPLELIKSLLPDVLVKGGDYVIDDIVGAKEVMANGGKVQTLSFVEGYSTSALEAKIRSW